MQSSRETSFLGELDRAIPREALACADLGDVIKVFDARLDLEQDEQPPLDILTDFDVWALHEVLHIRTHSVNLQWQLDIFVVIKIDDFVDPSFDLLEELPHGLSRILCIVFKLEQQAQWLQGVRIGASSQILA